MQRPNSGRHNREIRRSTVQKRRYSRMLDLLLTLSILAVLTLIVGKLANDPVTSEHKWSGIATVIDGDTLVLEDNRIRLKGIDAPEIKQSCNIQGHDIACGIVAKQALQQKISNKTIHCNSEAVDQYKRFLAICYLDDVSLNQWMVEEGQAISYYDYSFQERDARNHKRGIWAGEFERPQDWRQRTALEEQKISNDNFFQFDDFVGIINNFYNRIFNSGGADE
ncbi:thermonuclease family protein [Brucellaceae bacterium C25G]